MGSVFVPVSLNRWADSVLPLRTQTHLMVNLFPEYWIWVVPPFGFGFKWTASGPQGLGRKSRKEQKNLGRVSRGPPGSGPATSPFVRGLPVGEVGGWGDSWASRVQWRERESDGAPRAAALFRASVRAEPPRTAQP